MAPIHTILVPTDFSERSQYALGLAGALTRDYGARLVLVHVVVPQPIVYGEGVIPVEPEEYHAELRQRLDAITISGGDVRAERRLEEGDAAAEILRVAREIDANLIVMGTHGRTGLRRLIMGSVAEQVMRRAPCAVLKVKEPIEVVAHEEMSAKELVGAP